MQDLLKSVKDSDSVQELFRFLLDGLKAASATAQQEVPLIVQEYLKWYVYECWFWIGFGSLILLAALFASRVLYLAGKKAPKYDQDGWFAGSFSTLFMGGFLSLAILSSNVYALLKVVAAPRLVLIEAVKQLLN